MSETEPAAPSRDKPRSRGKRLRYRLEYGLLKAAVWLVPKLPLRLVRAVGSGAGMLAWLCDGRGRKNGMENLRAAFGDQYTVAQRRRILQGSYRVFGRTFLDLFWSPRIQEKDWDRYFTLQCDSPAAEAAIAKNQAIYVTAHFGGFEWLSIAKALRNWGSMIIAQDFKNPPLTAIFRELRSAGGRQITISREGAMLRLLKHLKKGGSAAALVDLMVPPEQSATVIRSFGLCTSVSLFHIALARRTGVPIVPILAAPGPDRRWVIRFFDPVPIPEDEPVPQTVQRCWDVFEPIIRAQPEYWLWMYKHWRFLPEGIAPECYPEYARPNPAFDALVRSVKAEAPGLLS